MINAVNTYTGESYEFADDNPTDIKNSWLEINETIKALERAKEKLKPQVMELLDEKGQYDYGDYIFKLQNVQRQTYDKSVMRKVLDPDTFDVLLLPDKTKVDTYLKENLADLGEASTLLRNSMVPVGSPYSVLKLEKIKR